jgi:hypothetical protein
VTIKGSVRLTAAEGVREAVFDGLGLAVTSEWMFAPESFRMATSADRSLGRVSSGRNVSIKARAFANSSSRDLERRSRQQTVKWTAPPIEKAEDVVTGRYEAGRKLTTPARDL